MPDPTRTDLILHHYPLSTFSEKIRLAFGLKRLAYWEVITPPAMPKPDLVPLTGGYRRAPVLQIGADIFCDTQLILNVIERLHPEPTLYPGGTKGQAQALGFWIERHAFMPALGFVANVNDTLFSLEFIEERRPFGFILGRDEVRPHFARHIQQLAAHLAWFETMLADGRPYVFGDDPSAADFAAYPTLWFLGLYGGDEARRLLPLDRLQPWTDRIAAIGHGEPAEIPGPRALEIARDHDPDPAHLAHMEPNGDPSGLADGQAVTVTPDDTGRDPVAGTLVRADANAVVIRRDTADLGATHLHFPRAGYDVAAA